MSSSKQVVPLADAPPPQATREPARVEPRDTTFYASPIDLFDELTPSKTILSKLWQRTYWGESASTVMLLIWDSALGGLVGWFVNYLYTFGNFLSGDSPAEQSYASFCAGVMGLTSFFLGCSLCVVQAASLVKLRFVDQPDRRPTLRNCIWRLVRRTWLLYLATLVLTVVIAYAIAALPASTHGLKLHFYVAGLAVNLYTTMLDLALRRTFQQETTEGQARSANGGAKRGGSFCRLVLRLMIKDYLLILTVYIAAAYIQVASAIRLDTSTELFIFSVSSYAFKLLTQEVTKNVMLHQKKTQVKTIYLAVAVPTVLIDTQIRVVILRQPTVSQSIAGSVAISIVEIVFRFLKIWLIRLEIWVHEKRTVRRIVRGGSTITSVMVSTSNGHVPTQPRRAGPSWWTRGSINIAHERPTIQDDARYVEFLEWRRRLLRFHAAEIHADMYAEYLAIVCSMSIYFFFHAHPKYAWTVAGGTSSNLNWKEQSAYLGAQIAMEMVVDMLSCLWELVNGVPMHNSKQMRAFITALFTACSVMNIVLSAAMNVKSSG